MEIHVHQSQLNDEVSSENSSSTGSLVVSPEVSASLMKDKFLVTAITLEDDKEDYYSQSKLNELLKVIINSMYCCKSSNFAPPSYCDLM